MERDLIGLRRQATRDMNKLKLIAFDADDLHVVSAHLQDAILRIGDMAFLPREKRFAAVLSRFDWAGAITADVGLKADGRDMARHQSALRFERVQAARTTGIDLGNPAEVLVLLAISFAGRGPEDPSGTLTLTFAGKAAVQLDVECLEAELKDLGPGWKARARPAHPADDDKDQSTPGC